MKSFIEFKGYLNEHMSQYAPASVDTTGTQDINIPEIKNELNRHIDLILRHHFVTIESAVQKLSKVLALYSLNIPLLDVNDKKSGSVDLVVGHNDTVYDEIAGKLVNSNPFILSFSYMLEDGLYKCSAKIE